MKCNVVECKFNRTVHPEDERYVNQCRFEADHYDDADHQVILQPMQASGLVQMVFLPDGSRYPVLVCKNFIPKEEGNGGEN